MARAMRWALWMIAAGLGAESARGADLLRELSRPDVASKVRIELKAEGKFLVAATPGRDAKTEPKPLTMKVESRYLFMERVLNQVQERPTRVARRVLQAVSVVQGEIRPSQVSMRPEVMTLIVEPAKDGSYVSTSPGGPLTRSELELVQGPGDPLSLGSLFSAKAVNPGDTWTVGDDLAKALSGYDTLSGNKLEASLKSIDNDKAELTLKGQIRGAALGGEGSMGLIGSATFDRKSSQVIRLRVDRAEVRQPGPVETGLDVQSSITFERTAVEMPAELDDTAVAGLPKLSEPDNAMLMFTSPDETYTLLHDRSWHVASDDIRQVVFKRLERGEVVAQGNFVVGPNAGKGRHQDVGQFRDDVKKALGARFVGVLGAGEVEGAPEGHFRYKVAVQGREGDVGLVWYYFLIANPAGDQLLVTFTLGQAQSETFGDADFKLIGGLEWTGKRRR